MSEKLESPSLEVCIAEAIRSALSSDSIRARVASAAEKAVAEAIDRCFGYSSDFRKSVEESVRAVLPIPKPDDMQEFGVAVRNVIQKRLSVMANEVAASHVGELLEKLLGNERVIYMEDLRTAFEEKIAIASDCSCDGVGVSEDDYTWEVEKSGFSEGYWDLVINPNPREPRYGSESTVLRFRESKPSSGQHQCWNVTAGVEDMNVGSIFTGPLFGFDAMVWRLATGVAVLSKDRKPVK